MSLTEEQVRHIANLARLELPEDELNRYRGQLSAILEFFQQLNRVDTEGILPTSSGFDLQSALRKDGIQPGLAVEDLLKNAPETTAQQFRVPPVFD